VFLTDAPAEDLDTFVLTISQVRLVTDTGGTVIASDGTVEQDLLNLVMIQKLIASEFIAPGVYTGLELDVDDITATANGNSLTISEPKPAVIVVRFEDPVTLLPDSQAMITLDFDVEDSVADDPSDPSGNTIIVEPVMFVDVRSKHIDLEDFEGIVQSVDSPLFTVLVIESSGPGSAEPVGMLTVQVSESTRFETENNTFVSGLAGLALLSGGIEVEVEGSFNGTVVEADDVELEGMVVAGLRFEGLVTSVSVDGLGNAFTDTTTLKVLKVKEDPAGDLAGLDSVEVDLESGPAVFKAAIGMMPDEFDVVLGEKLDVRGNFVATDSKVNATLVELEKTRFEGTVTAVSDISITLEPLTAERFDVPGLTSRTFTIEATTAITIDDILPIGADELAIDQVVKVKAALDVDNDKWVAIEIEREANDFDSVSSEVISIDIGTNSFVMQGDGTDLGLGSPATLTVKVLQDTRILLVQDGTQIGVTRAQLLETTLAGLPGTARVKVEGILEDPSTLTLLATEIVLKP
jgi:hypothetical protein